MLLACKIQLAAATFEQVWFVKTGRWWSFIRPIFRTQSIISGFLCEIKTSIKGLIPVQSDYIQISHFLPFIGMSRRVRTEDTSLWITFESLTFFPLLVCRGV